MTQRVASVDDEGRFYGLVAEQLAAATAEAIVVQDMSRKGAVSVTDEGAVGDYSQAGGGGTDNYAAITAAIAACPPGGTVALSAILQPNNTGARYYCSDTLIIDKPIKLTGAGAKRDGTLPSSTLVFPAGKTGIIVRADSAGVAPSGWSIEGLAIESLATAVDSGVGIYATHGAGMITDVAVRDFGSHGIHLKAGVEHGGGNVNNSLLTRVRAYGNRGDGIRLEGTDVQAILMLKPDIVANYGWGIHLVNGAAVTTVIGAHFNQSLNAAPGAFRDNSASSAWINVYAEGGGNGSKAELAPNSYDTYVSYSTYAGLTVTDLSAGKTAWIEDRRRGKHRFHQIVESALLHAYRQSVSQDTVGAWELSYVALSGSPYTAKTVMSYSRSSDIIAAGAPMGPSSVAGDNVLDLGRTAYRWRHLFQGGYHDIGEMTAPAAPPANTARLYAEDNGAGKTRLMVRFPTGAAVQIAIEP